MQCSETKSTCWSHDNKNCIQILQQPKEEVEKWLKSFDYVLTDCDGVLWIFSELITGSRETINKFKELGKKVYFVTNNSTKTREEFLTKANDFGFNMELDDMKCTAHAVAEYLKKLEFNKTVYIIGASGIGKELDAIGIAHTGIGPDPITGNLSEYINNKNICDKSVCAVVVGFDEHYSFAKMIKAAVYLDNPDCLFIGTNTDERYPMPNIVIPGAGSFVRSVETFSERKATIVGKPFKNICQSLIDNKHIDPCRTLMIGDKCNTDILFGKNCGFQTLLVGTGINSLNDVQKWQESFNEEDKKLIPDYYIPSLGDLLKFM